MDNFKIIYDSFRLKHNIYFILLKKSSETLSIISKTFQGFDLCDSNTIYLISEKILKTLDKTLLPQDAFFLQISFEQFLEVIENLPDENILRIIDDDKLEVTIMIEEVKRYKEEHNEQNTRFFNSVLRVLFLVFTVFAICLRGVYLYTSYALIYNILAWNGFIAVVATIGLFMLLNKISDKLITNFLTNLKD